MNIASIKKLEFPSFLANQECKVVIEKEGISEEGEPIEELSIVKKCIFRERDKTIISKEGKKIILNGEVLIQGDISSDSKNISNGYIELNEKKYYIYSGYRVRNPDGTVNHTKFEVI